MDSLAKEITFRKNEKVIVKEKDSTVLFIERPKNLHSTLFGEERGLMDRESKRIRKHL